MTARRFHFQTAAQWGTCLFARADGDLLRRRGTVQPFPAYSRAATLFASAGASAPAVTPAGDLIWRDRAGCLLRITGCDEQPTRSAAPAALAAARRVIANLAGLWAVAPTGNAVHRFDTESLSRVLTIDLPGSATIDIAGGGPHRIHVLVSGDGGPRVLEVDPAGRIVSTITLPGEVVANRPEATALAYLQHSRRLVVLGGMSEQRLYWFDRDGQLLFSRPVAALHRCFAAEVLGSDGRERLFVAGQDPPPFDDGPIVLVLDAEGNVLGDVPVGSADAPVTGVTGSGGALFVAGGRGLLRYGVAERVPDGAGELQAMLLTPMLSAPDREDRRRWLRVEAIADLPEGATLEIAVAHTADRETRDRLLRLANDSKANASERITALLGETDVWRPATVSHGRTTASGGPPDAFTAPLFDITDPYVWVLVTLRAAPGARLPKLSSLDVLYPGRTLMEHLPAIYQREEDRPGSFLRALVGVLETTTQGLDARIGEMSGQLLPERAPAPWLDFVAQWLGVPWDEAMSDAQKRRVLANAASLGRDRGTRIGLETLLESLLPTGAGAQRRYRVTDATADFGFARVGGNGCAGSVLPALLGGRTRWQRELGRDAILGRMRLPCSGDLADGARHLVGRIGVDVAANADERRSMEPWLEAVLREMVPLTARLRLRWVPRQALRSGRLDGTLTLEGAPAAELGSGAITGLARLREGRARLSGVGPTLGTPLR